MGVTSLLAVSHAESSLSGTRVSMPQATRATTFDPTTTTTTTGGKEVSLGEKNMHNYVYYL